MNDIKRKNLRSEFLAKLADDALVLTFPGFDLSSWKFHFIAQNSCLRAAADHGISVSADDGGADIFFLHNQSFFLKSICFFPFLWYTIHHEAGKHPLNVKIHQSRQGFTVPFLVGAVLFPLPLFLFKLSVLYSMSLKTQTLLSVFHCFNLKKYPV